MIEAFSDRSADQSDFRKYLAAIQKHWKLIALLVVLAVGGALAASAASTPRYYATADLLVTPVSNNDETFVGINVFREPSDQSRSVLTVTRLLDSLQIARIAKRQLHTSLSASALLRRIDIQPVGQADIVGVRATAQTAGGSAAIANAFARAMVTERTQRFQHDVITQVNRLRTYLRAIPSGQRESNESITIQQRLAQLLPLVGAADPTLQIANLAVPPTSPGWPRRKLAVAIAFAAMLVLGSALAIALELWDPNVRDENEILFNFRLPILARVPRLKTSEARGYLSGSEPLPAASWEAYRRLRVSLEGARAGAAPRSIVITSASPGEGKTMTSVNLALSIASTGKRVVLVDADLRHPMIASIFKVVPPQHGLQAAFSARSIEQLLVRPREHPNLALLLARPENAAIVDAITRENVRTLVDSITSIADMVVFDTAPVGEAAESLAFAESTDLTVLAARLGFTRRDRLADALRMFSQRNIATVGVALTTDRSSQTLAYHYEYSGPPQPTLRGPRVAHITDNVSDAAGGAARAATAPRRR